MAFDYKSSYYLYKKYYFEFERLYKSKKEVRVYVGLSAAILLMAFFVVMAIKPTLTTIAALRADIRSQEEVNARLEEKVNSMRQAFANYEKVKNRFYLIEEAGPIFPWAVRFMRQVEGAAGERGVGLSSIGFEKISPESEHQATEPLPFRQAGFTLTAKGAFEQLDSFINLLESLRRVVIIDSYSYAAGEPGAGALTVNIQGGVVYLSQ